MRSGNNNFPRLSASILMMVLLVFVVVLQVVTVLKSTSVGVTMVQVVDATATGGSPSTSTSSSPSRKLHFDVYDLQPAIHWACEPFLELKYIEQLHPMQEETRNICLKLRAGKLEKDNSNNNNNNNSADTDTDHENGNDGVRETEDNVTELPTVVVEEDDEVEEKEEEEEKEESITVSTDITPTSSTAVAEEMVTTEEEEEVETSVLVDDINSNSKDQSKDDDGPELLLPPSEEEEDNKEESLNDETTTTTTTEGTTQPDSNGDQTSNKPGEENYEFSVFQKNDGHETDPDGIPTRYMVMQNNRRDLAKIALQKTIDWRKEHDIDTILARPHPKFDISKKVFPHYFCGRDDTNHVILLQRPGLMNIKLAHKNGLTGEGLLYHYVYVMEYLWRIVDPSPDATMTSILDLTEMNMSVLRGEQFRIGSLFLSTMDANFPQRSHKTLLINAPKWFGVLFKLASPLLRESTKQKIQILSKGKEQDQILQQLLSECPIPDADDTEFLSVPPGIMEEELRNFCLARLEDAGEEMELVIPE